MTLLAYLAAKIKNILAYSNRNLIHVNPIDQFHLNAWNFLSDKTK